MAHRITAKPTEYDGIEFRSRLEASWYAYFRALGMQPEYEPITLEVNMNVWGECDWKSYLPDFRISVGGHKFFVEVKPLVDSYAQRDIKSINLACVLGYTERSIIILGSPLKYFAVWVNERHKGDPCGSYVRFFANYLGVDDRWHGQGQPDEGIDVDHLICCDLDRASIVDNSGDMRASQAWNDTKWHP